MKRIAFIFVLIIFSTSIIAQENITVFVYSTKQLNEPTAALRSSIVGALVNNGDGKYKVVDRSDEFMKILGMEVAYQEKGFVSNKQLTAAGEQLGAQKVCGVVITDYGCEGGGYQFECNIIDVKTGAVEAHADYPIGEDKFVCQLNIVNSRLVAQGLAKQLKLFPPEQKNTKKSTLPTFEFNEETYMVAPDPGNKMSYEDAKAYCNNLTLEGYSDWIMPSKEQCQMMYTKRYILGGFERTAYWVVSKSGKGVVQYYDEGKYWESNDYYKYYHVRPIRKVTE